MGTKTMFAAWADDQSPTQYWSSLYPSGTNNECLNGIFDGFSQPMVYVCDLQQLRQTQGCKSNDETESTTFEYIGCYADKSAVRALPVRDWSNNGHINPDSCQASCSG